MKTDYKSLSKNDNPDKPLSVEIKDKVLTISVGVSVLAFIVEDECCIRELRKDDSEKPAYSVTNNDAFAEDVLRELTREEEDGTMPIHTLLDKAVLEAIEQGSAFIQETK